MKTVRIKKTDLIERLTANRKNHRAQFEIAFEGYRKECIDLLSRNLTELRAGNKIVIKFYEVAPEDHTSDYDTVLAMLAMSVDDTIELTHDEFQQYVEDDWSWRERWNTSNVKYMSR